MYIVSYIYRSNKLPFFLFALSLFTNYYNIITFLKKY